MASLQDIINGLKSGEIKSSSEFNIMNEIRQKNFSGSFIPKLAYSFQKRSRLYYWIQMALPFNPETGKPDENYNSIKKWRPMISPSDAAKVIKFYSSQNEEAHKSFMTRAGVTKWDVSTPDVLNKDDFKVLRKYRVPLVVTADAISINSEQVTGSEYGQKYSVEVERDAETNQILKEPPISKIGRFVSAIQNAEVAELKEAVDKGDSNIYRGNNKNINVTAIPEADDSDLKDWVLSIISGGIMSSVRPASFCYAFELALEDGNRMLDKNGNTAKEFLQLDSDDLKERVVYTDFSGKHKEYIESVLSNELLDVFWDFVEADYLDKSPKSPETKLEKAAASRKMQPAQAAHSLYDLDKSGGAGIRYPWGEDLLKAFSDYMGGDPDFEKKMMRFLAGRLSVLTPEIIGRTMDVVAKQLPIDYLYISEDMFRQHRDAMQMLYADEYLERAIELGIMSTEQLEDSEDSTVISAADIMVEEARQTYDDIIDDIIDDVEDKPEDKPEEKKPDDTAFSEIEPVPEVDLD